MRGWIKPTELKSVFIALFLAFTLTAQLACDSNKLAKNADRGAQALTQVKPVVQSLIDGQAIPRARGEDILRRLDQGAALFTALASAFRAGDNASTLDQVDGLITLLNQLISQDVLVITDQTRRTTVLTFLAAADLALGIIADNLVEAEGQSTSRSVPSGTAKRIKAYAKKPPMRCRDSVSGQFRKMDYCKANPATTTVER